MGRGGLRVLVAAACAAVTAAPALAQEAPAETVLVTYATEGALDRATAGGGPLDQADGGVEEVAGRVAVAELTPAEAADIADDPGVLAVEPDAEVHIAEPPNDPCYTSPSGCGGLGAWHIDRVGLPGAWDVSHGTDVVVAVVDSGVTAPPNGELAGKLLPEIDATATGSTPSGTPPCETGLAADHGTRVSSVLGAVTSNGTATAGAGWDVLVRPVRVWQGPTCGGTTLSYVLNGITLARNSGARVINLSLTTGSATALQATVDDAIAAGVVIVAAAGNGNPGSDNPGAGDGGWPAAQAGVIAVGATATDDTRASFSNFGTWVDLYAPGARIPSVRRDGTLGSLDGTSFSAPIVSGVVALMLAVRPALSPADVSVLLTRTADSVNGVLRFDAREALYDTMFNTGVVPGLGPAALGTGSGTLEVFSRTNVGAVWARSMGGSNTRWAATGGLAVGDPDVASAGPGRVDLVVRGVDGAAYHQFRTASGPWSGWAPLGNGQFTSALTVTSPVAGQLAFFGRGLDGAMWTARLDGSTFSGWTSLGGGFTSEPDAVSFGSGRVGVFAVGLDGAIWGRMLSGTWGPWSSLGGGLTSGPGAASMAPDRVDLVARGLDGAVYHRSWNGVSWSPWSSLGGFVTSAPDLATRGIGTLDVLARAPDSQLWRRTLNGGVWGGWESTG